MARAFFRCFWRERGLFAHLRALPAGLMAPIRFCRRRSSANYLLSLPDVILDHVLHILLSEASIESARVTIFDLEQPRRPSEAPSAAAQRYIQARFGSAMSMRRTCHSMHSAPMAAIVPQVVLCLLEERVVLRLWASRFLARAPLEATMLRPHGGALVEALTQASAQQAYYSDAQSSAYVMQLMRALSRLQPGWYSVAISKKVRMAKKLAHNTPPDWRYEDC